MSVHSLLCKPRLFTSDMIKEKELLNMQIDWDSAEEHEKYIFKDYRRRKGILRKEQLDITNIFDDNIIYNQEAFPL